MGIQVQSWDWCKHVAELNWFKGFTIFLDEMISHDNTGIEK
jgi:hypothetical protein